MLTSVAGSSVFMVAIIFRYPLGDLPDGFRCFTTTITGRPSGSTVGLEKVPSGDRPPGWRNSAATRPRGGLRSAKPRASIPLSTDEAPFDEN